MHTAILEAEASSAASLAATGCLRLVKGQKHVPASPKSGSRGRLSSLLGTSDGK